MRRRLASLALALSLMTPAAIGLSLASPAPAAAASGCRAVAVIWQLSHNMVEGHGTVTCTGPMTKVRIYMEYQFRPSSGGTWSRWDWWTVGTSFSPARYAWSNDWITTSMWAGYQYRVYVQGQADGVYIGDDLTGWVLGS